MGCLKTLAYAGAVAMVATSALVSAPALAADLGQPPMMAPPPPPPMMMDGMSGLYLRGDIGVGVMSSSKMTPSFMNAPGGVPGFLVDKYSFDNVGFAGVGIGYQFNNFLRFDLTAEFRTQSKFSALESYNGTSFGITCVKCYDSYGASIGTNVFMANGYVDLGTWRGITPFVGVGVGIAQSRIKGLYDRGEFMQAGFGTAPDSSRSNMAWALMAGLGFEVTRNLKMEIGYRYLNMGEVSSNPIICSLQNTGLADPNCAREVHKYGLASHDVKVGFRYLLADDSPPSMPAGGPLIRKY